MSTNVVNLDALIPREDLAIEDKSTPSGTVDKITIPHLNSFVFAPDLRKPYFQRETNQWTPKKIVELLTAFIDRDLIPAVILWRACNDPAVPAQIMRLMQMLGLGFSSSAPDEAVDGYKNVSSRQSHGWRAAWFRIDADGYIALLMS